MATGRFPGPLGYSKTSGLVQNTRRPLGIEGVSAAALISPEPVNVAGRPTPVSLKTSPVVLDRPVKASRMVGASGSGSGGERSLGDFKEAVKGWQIRFLQGRGRVEFEDVPDSELEIIEGRHRLRRPAALACRALLAKVRGDLAGAQAAKDHRAKATQSIGIQSAYRNFAEDGQAWRNTFAKHYELTRVERAALRGGAHGDAAVLFFGARMANLKAPPGWSNHSNAMAVDFNTRVGAVLFRALSEQRGGWKTTWLHAWLVEHAPQFGFYPYAKEEWHWDYR